MSTEITRRRMPEERELAMKLSELAALESELSQRELDLATLRAELHVFQAQYFRIVGIRYAELDEIEAQVAEAQARLSPGERETQERAKQARFQAQESAQAAGAVQESGQQNEFSPSENLKKLFREVAKSIHPDLATDEEERARRHGLMAEANRAYEEGDEVRLQAILREWESSPESIKGNGPGAELVRVIRKIAQVQERLRIIEAEITQLEKSDLYQLQARVKEAEAEGHDLLAEMADRVDEQIADARRRLVETTRRKANT